MIEALSKVHKGFRQPEVVITPSTSDDEEPQPSSSPSRKKLVRQHTGEVLADKRRPWMEQLRAHKTELPWEAQPFLEGVGVCVAYVVWLVYCASSSILQPVAVTLLYSAFIWFSSRLMKLRTRPFQRRVGEYMIVYNIFQVIVSMITISLIVSEIIRLNYTIYGNPVDPSHQWLALLIMSHYQHQYALMLDTVFLVVRKKFDEISWLHMGLRLLYIWSWFLAVRLACGGDSYFRVLVQCVVRMPSYLFFLSSLIGIKPTDRWKRLLSHMQQTSHATLAVYSILVLMDGNNNYFIWVWTLSMNVSSLVAFTNFHRESGPAKADRLSRKKDPPPGRLVFSFDACAWLLFYHIGVAMYVKNVLMPRMKKTDFYFSGASAGACLSAALVCNIDISALKAYVLNRRPMCISHPWLLMKVAEDGMDHFLPTDCHERASGSIRILGTRCMMTPPFFEGEVFDQFQSPTHLKQVIRASSHVPLLAGFPYKMGSEYYIDGLWWSEDVVPWRTFRPNDFVIRVSAWSAPSSDIHPQLLLPPWWSVSPPSEEVLEGLVASGFEDAEAYFAPIADGVVDVASIKSMLINGKERDFMFSAHRAWVILVLLMIILTLLTSLALALIYYYIRFLN